jgi:hypothetical protein
VPEVSDWPPNNLLKTPLLYISVSSTVLTVIVTLSSRPECRAFSGTQWRDRGTTLNKSQSDGTIANLKFTGLPIPER